MRVKRFFLIALLFFVFSVASVSPSSSKAAQTLFCPGDPCGCDEIYNSCRRGCNFIADINERFACAERCLRNRMQCNIACCGFPQTP